MKNAITLLAIYAAIFLMPAQTKAQKLAAAKSELSSKQFGRSFHYVPDRRDASIYQVNIRAFSQTGDFKGVIARMDSIKALGINVVYLMPIYPVGQLKSVNSPYCVQNYRAVNPEFGTLQNLRALVAAAHERKMAVMLDWVANHTSFDNPWTKNKDWYKLDSAGKIASPPNGWTDVAQLNFSNKNMRLAMIAAMKYWVLTANIDGFRCDYADGPPADFWKQAIDTLRRIPAHQLLFLAEGKRSANFAAGFDYNFGFSFFENLEKIYKNQKSVQSIDSLNTADYIGATNGQRMVRYTTNHDVNSSDGTPLALFGGKKGSIAAFVVVAYMKSVPMVYGGQEVATPFRITFPFTSTKIDWTINPDVTAEYKKILAFRNNSKAIRRGELKSYTTANVCAFTKEAGSEKVFVLANLRDTAVAFQVPPVLVNTSWKGAFDNAAVKLQSTISLKPYSYIVLKN